MAFVNNNIPGAAVAVTPSDTAQQNLIGIYVGGTGDVNITDGAGNTTLFSAVPVGTQIWLDIVRVKSTSTTATLIAGFRAR